MRLLRMKAGYGEVVLAEGDVRVAADEARLVATFRAQIDAGLWAAVPRTTPAGQRSAEMVRSFEEIPRDAERVIFVPRASGG